MDYMSVVIEAFWEVMTSATTLIVPVIVVILLFSIIKGLLFNDR